MADEKKMRIFIARNTRIGSNAAERGATVSCPVSDALYLIGLGKAFDPANKEHEAKIEAVRKQLAAEKKAAASN